jgi:putative tricarboxylic transport membrane protein
MSNHGGDTDNSPAVANNRLMDIIVAALLLAMASVFMWDSVKIGIGWTEGQGPAPGFFPFWVSLLMAVASIINIVRAALSLEEDGDGTFVTRTALVRVLTVLVPTMIYVLLIQFIGIYVASAIFIIGFMIASKESPLRAIPVGLGVPLALFMMFEKWFLVPLPKGPLETMLGLG